MRRSSVLVLIPLLATLSCSEQPVAPQGASPSAPSPDVVAVNGIVPISAIQGAGHRSPFVGQSVTTNGVVTAVAFNGYYIQDPVGDGDDDTAEGLFVFMGSAPKPSVGDMLELTDFVSEFIPGGAGTGNLSITQMSFPATTLLSTGNALPAPVIVGSSGRIPPEVFVISPDEEPVNLQFDVQAAGEFNPEVDGIDFYESLEGMLVTVEDPVAVSGVRTFSPFSSEVFTLTNNGANITPADARTERGGINLQPDPDNRGDQNPERVQIQFDGTLYPGSSVPIITVGDRLSDVTGVVGYSFGNFEVNATEIVTVTPSGLQQEVTGLDGAGNRLTVASYNVLNLNPLPGSAGQRASLGAQIVNNLGAPDVIALQEIQDNNGTIGGAGNPETDASLTLQSLVDAIVAAGGPAYVAFDVAPPVPGVSGGAPGSNIRNAFLYNPDRVELGSFVSLTPAVLAAAGVTNPNAFDGSRSPLSATFVFKGREITIINNHLTSRFGSTPVFGGPQPFFQAGETEREQQSQALNDYVDYLLALDKQARIAVVGDFNTFEFSNDLTLILPGALDGKPVLENLLAAMPDDNRYTFNFEGNSQVLDHIFVTKKLMASAQFDIVHTNVDFPRVDASVASDHEPLVADLLIHGEPE